MCQRRNPAAIPPRPRNTLRPTPRASAANRKDSMAPTDFTLMHEHIHVEATMMNRSRESSRRARQLRNAMHTAICALALTMIAPPVVAEATVQKHFASPAEGIAALAEAVKSGDAATLRAILGPGGGILINSGDAVADEQSRR